MSLHLRTALHHIRWPDHKLDHVLLKRMPHHRQMIAIEKRYIAVQQFRWSSGVGLNELHGGSLCVSSSDNATYRHIIRHKTKIGVAFESAGDFVESSFIET